MIVRGAVVELPLWVMVLTLMALVAGGLMGGLLLIRQDANLRVTQGLARENACEDAVVDRFFAEIADVIVESAKEPRDPAAFDDAVSDLDTVGQALEDIDLLCPPTEPATGPLLPSPPTTTEEQGEALNDVLASLSGPTVRGLDRSQRVP